jgi:pimeloyl-ACP methyl ester carboxylesterase
LTKPLPTDTAPQLAGRLPLRNADLRGAVRLATDATAGLADLVEAVHARIASLPGTTAAADARTGGVSGFVYRTIRGVTRLVGGSLDALLGALAPVLSPSTSELEAAAPSRERGAIVDALNGVLGDYLAASGNPLATALAFRRDGRPLDLEAEALAAALPDASGRVLVLLHGLCMGDLQWERDGHDHGAALARDLGFTPVRLHYNSGLHVSINGRAFGAAMEQLLRHWPCGIERVVLIGHSMGGLVARSALHQAQQARQAWPARIDDLVCLGTPHHGAPLERAGHWIDVVLGATPYAAPFARLGKLRSAGITDLRHGNLLDEDWVGVEGLAGVADRRQPAPLPSGIRCFAAAACLGAEDSDRTHRLIGDGLVPLDSALGRHADPAHSLDFASDRQWVGYGMGHLDLLSRPEVYAQLRDWLRDDRDGP